MVEMDKPLFTLTAFLAYTYTTLKSPSLVQSTPYAVITLKPFVNQRVWGKLWRLHGIFGKLCLYFLFFCPEVADGAAPAKCGAAPHCCCCKEQTLVLFTNRQQQIETRFIIYKQ